MRKQIETHFPIVLTNGCLQTVSDTEFGISEMAEDKGGKCIVGAKEGADFEVDNPIQKNITFWAIDDCTFSSAVSDGKRCDFAIFDDETIAFAEIKRSSTKQRSAAKAEAVIQLSAMLEQCRDKLDFNNYKLLAIIALTFSKSYPIARTRKQDAELSFFNKYRAQLVEGNGITFPFVP